MLSRAIIEQKTSWMTHERRNWIALAVLVAIVFYAIGFGNYKLTQHKIQTVSTQAVVAEKKAVDSTKQVTVLKRQLSCEQYRAALASDLAAGAIGFDLKDLPTCDGKGNPH